MCLLSWYHWSDSVWVEEAKQRLRNRALESRKRRERLLESTTEEMSMATSIEESNKGFEFGEDDEDISIIDEPSLLKLEEAEIEELSSISGIGIRQRKQPEKPEKVDVSIGTSEAQSESSC